MTLETTKIITLTRFLVRCCYQYYVKADPIISDHAFDLLFKDLQEMEYRAGGAEPDSPTQIIWGDAEKQYPDWAKGIQV